MRKLLVGVAVLCLLAPALSLVAGSLHASGTVVSVDLKAKSITLKYAYKNEPPKQATGKWDDRTKWWDQPQPFAEPRAMTAELAKSLQARLHDRRRDRRRRPHGSDDIVPQRRTSPSRRTLVNRPLPAVLAPGVDEEPPAGVTRSEPVVPRQDVGISAHVGSCPSSRWGRSARSWCRRLPSGSGRNRRWTPCGLPAPRRVGRPATWGRTCRRHEDGDRKSGVSLLLDEARLDLLDAHVPRLDVLDELHDHAAASLLAGEGRARVVLPC